MSKGQSSGVAKQTEKKLVEKTGKAAGDKDKSAQEKFDDMGEREEIKREANR